MPVSEIGYLELWAIAVMWAITVVLVFVAFFSLRRTDEVILKARIYMNRRRISTGLLFLGLGMAVFLVQVLVELTYVAFRGERLPIEVTGGLFVVAVACLVKGFHDFYSLSKAPARPAGTREAR